MGNLYGTVDTLSEDMLLADPMGAVKKGIVVTLGNGLLEKGTVVVRNSSTGMYAPATSETLIAGSIAAVLAEDTQTGTAETGLAVATSAYFRGEFLRGMVKLATGALPTAAYGVLNAMGILLQEYVPATGAEDTLDNAILETVATPAAAPGAGEVASGTEVALATSTSGAAIYYTVDGSTPTASSTLYAAAIEVTAPVTIKAIAVKDGMNNSAVLTAAYTIAA